MEMPTLYHQRSTMMTLVLMVGCANTDGARFTIWLGLGMLSKVPLLTIGGRMGTNRLLSAEAVKVLLRLRTVEISNAIFKLVYRLESIAMLLAEI